MILQKIRFIAGVRIKERKGGGVVVQRSLCTNDVVRCTKSSLAMKILYVPNITFINKCQDYSIRFVSIASQ